MWRVTAEVYGPFSRFYGHEVVVRPVRWRWLGHLWAWLTLPEETADGRTLGRYRIERLTLP